MVVLCFSSSLRHGSSAAGVGAKLRCALCAEKANRESGLYEEGDSPLDRLLRLRRDALEDRVQPAQMRLALAWGSPDILGDRTRTLAGHLGCREIRSDLIFGFQISAQG